MDLHAYQTHMTSEEINVLPLVRYEGPITLIRTQGELFQALPALRSEPILGFDTETRPTFRKGRVNRPSLIQLATANQVYLVQLSWLPFGRELASIFSSPRQLKVGVGIDEDMRELARIFPFTPAGHIDLGSIARRHELWSQGLRPLSANFFGERISKGPQCSNWSLRNLTQRQLVYAATDAWIGRRLFLRMRELGLMENL